MLATMENGEVLNLYKPVGMTPLQTMDIVREQHPEYRDIRMTYAGRLDPMAEGVLVVLIGEKVYEKEAYLTLDKMYEADIVIGVGTDTHDLLGMPTVCNVSGALTGQLESEIKNMKGVFEYLFPPYSSKPVNGKPLFQWAREDRLHEIEIPKRMMRVSGVELLDRYTVSCGDIKNKAEATIAQVQGDFRQQEILKQWQSVFIGMDNNTAFLAVRLRVNCASGTYVRTLAHELGKRLGTDAMLLRLVRTRVGDFKVEDSLALLIEATPLAKEAQWG